MKKFLALALTIITIISLGMAVYATADDSGHNPNSVEYVCAVCGNTIENCVGHPAHNPLPNSLEDVVETPSSSGHNKLDDTLTNVNTVTKNFGNSSLEDEPATSNATLENETKIEHKENNYTVIVLSLVMIILSIFVIVFAIRNATLNKMADKAERKVAEAENKVSDAERKAADAENKVSDAERKAAEAENKLSAAERKVADAENKVSDAERKVADAENKVSDAERKAAEAENKLSATERKVADAENKVSDAERKVADAKCMLEIIVTEKDCYATFLNQKADEARRLIKFLHQLASENPSLENQIAEFLEPFEI